MDFECKVKQKSLRSVSLGLTHCVSGKQAMKLKGPVLSPSILHPLTSSLLKGPFSHIIKMILTPFYARLP